MKTDNIICAYEYEIINWIKNNHKLLGYDKIIQENKNKVPDLVMLKVGKKINVEVEIYSSSFIKHKHSIRNVDEVLCIFEDSKLPVKTTKIKQLKLWYQLQGDELVDFFKARSDTILVDHRSGQIIHHFQDEWVNLSKEKEKIIRENLKIQSKFLNDEDTKELREIMGNIFD